MTKKPKATKTTNVQIGKTGAAKVNQKAADKQTSGKSTKLSVHSSTDKSTMQKNTKQAQLIEMLRRVDGATIQQIMDITGWQQHSVRGFLSGTIKKKLGLIVSCVKNKNSMRTYHIQKSISA